MNNLAGRKIRCRHNRSFTNFLKPLDHYALPWLQALFDHPEITAPVADSHRLEVDFVIGIDHGHLEVALQFRNRPLGYKQ